MPYARFLGARAAHLVHGRVREPDLLKNVPEVGETVPGGGVAGARGPNLLAHELLQGGE